MARMIIDVAEDTLEEFFFGDWRNQYIQIIQTKATAANYKRYHKENKNQAVKQSKFLLNFRFKR